MLFFVKILKKIKNIKALSLTAKPDPTNLSLTAKLDPTDLGSKNG
jgi:hypothetical protein